MSKVPPVGATQLPFGNILDYLKRASETAGQSFASLITAPKDRQRAGKVLHLSGRSHPRSIVARPSPPAGDPLRHVVESHMDKMYAHLSPERRGKIRDAVAQALENDPYFKKLQGKDIS